MKPDSALRTIVRLMREANEGNADAWRRVGLLNEGYVHSRDSLDVDAAVAELLDMTREPSVELRYSLARWIAGKITLKRGRKAGGVKRAARIGPRLQPLDARLCVDALMEFGTALVPIGVHPYTRLALADLLTKTRRLRSGPRLAPVATAPTFFAAHNVRLYVSDGMSIRAAIRRAAKEAKVEPGTLQRWIYPRDVR